MPIDDKEAGTCISYTVQQMLRKKPTDAEVELEDTWYRIQLDDTWDRIHFMREDSFFFNLIFF